MGDFGEGIFRINPHKSLPCIHVQTIIESIFERDINNNKKRKVNELIRTRKVRAVPLTRSAYIKDKYIQSDLSLRLKLYDATINNH